MWPSTVGSTRLDLFSACTRSELRQIDGLTTRLRLPKGRVLMREGEAPKEFVIIGSGRVRVTRDTDAGATVVSDLGSGEILGEMALLMGTHRKATATAATDLTVFVCSVSEFRSHPAHLPLGGPQGPPDTADSGRGPRPRRLTVGPASRSTAAAWSPAPRRC